LVAAIEHKLVNHEAVVESGGRIGVGKQLRLDEAEGSGFCDTYSASGYAKVGCGTCAESCNEYDTVELSATTDDTFDTVGACKSKCNGESDCKGITIEKVSDTEIKCTTHNTLPYMHGAVCSGKCDNDGSCGGSVCMAKTTTASSARRIIELGKGACASPGRSDDQLTVIKTTNVAAGGASGLTTVTNDCKTECEGDEDCRAYSVGERQCDGAGSEHICQLYSDRAAQAVQDPSGLTLQLCTDFCSSGACTVVVANTKCYAKTHFADSEKEWMLRSDGACIGESWAGSGSASDPVEATQDSQTVLADTAGTSKERNCQTECEGDSNCKGVSFTISTNSAQDSFCRLYSDNVVAGSKKLRQEELCDACKEDAGSPCQCSGSTQTSRLCCSDCKACADQYTSKCFAYGVA
jgi:hypothetical protein